MTRTGDITILHFGLQKNFPVLNFWRFFFLKSINKHKLRCTNILTISDKILLFKNRVLKKWKSQPHHTPKHFIFSSKKQTLKVTIR